MGVGVDLAGMVLRSMVLYAFDVMKELLASSGPLASSLHSFAYQAFVVAV